MLRNALLRIIILICKTGSGILFKKDSSLHSEYQKSGVLLIRLLIINNHFVIPIGQLAGGWAVREDLLLLNSLTVGKKVSQEGNTIGQGSK